jgi:hypothetical protein
MYYDMKFEQAKKYWNYWQKPTLETRLWVRGPQVDSSYLNRSKVCKRM